MESSESRSYSPALATASLVLAVLAAVSMMFIYVAVPLGALAILLALLSRGNGNLFGKARTGLVLGLCAMAASAVITGYSFYRVMTDPALKARFEQILDYYMTYYLGVEEEVEEPSFAPDGVIDGVDPGDGVIPGEELLPGLQPAYGGDYT